MPKSNGVLRVMSQMPPSAASSHRFFARTTITTSTFSQFSKASMEYHFFYGGSALIESFDKQINRPCCITHSVNADPITGNN